MSDSRYVPFNLEDIARLSGVSRSTVSRVVNNHPNVSERTRQQVLEVINKYNFQPNPAARALASQRSKVIGVLIPHIVADIFSDPFFPILLQGVTSRANMLDYGVTLWLSSTEPTENGVMDRVLNNRLLDGLIIAEALVDAPFLEILEQRGKPFVLVGHPVEPSETANYVDVENVVGGRLMTRHLLERGRRRIGLIPGRLELMSSYDRQIGYLSAMEEAGLSDESLIGPPGNFTEKGGYHSMQYLLQRNVDAVFCASDWMALGAIRAIKEAGLQIPDDVAVGGYDDMGIAAKIDPPLTTIRQPISQLGDSAAQGLIGLLESTEPIPYQRILPVELIVRQST